MRYSISIFFLSLLASCRQIDAPSQTEPARKSLSKPTPSSMPAYEVFFSPGRECETAYIRHIDSAKSTILVQAYGFTSDPIAAALVRAHARGVDVEVVVDKSETKQKSEAAALRQVGIPVSVDSAHPIAHNKVVIVDHTIVATGSYNLTRNARANAENCLFIWDPVLAARYTNNWKQHRAHSNPL